MRRSPEAIGGVVNTRRYQSSSSVLSWRPTPESEASGEKGTRMGCQPSVGGSAVCQSAAAFGAATNAHSHVPLSDIQESRANCGRG